MTDFYKLHLQLFADGGEGGAGANGDQGGEGTATVIYGVQPEVQPENGNQKPAEEPKTDPGADFDALIKGQYKDQYGKKVQKAVEDRIKGLKPKAEAFDSMAPLLELLGKRHGINPDKDGHYDINAIYEAADADDHYLEDEADERGMSVQELKAKKAADRELANLRRQNQQLLEQMNQQHQTDEANRIYAGWMDEAKEVSKIYKGFDLQREIQNPDFVRLLEAGVSVQAAFKSIHMDELMKGGMQYAVEQTAKQAAASVRSNGSRPRENGNAGNAAAVYKSNVSELTDADMDEIKRRVSLGERISFG